MIPIFTILLILTSLIAVLRLVPIREKQQLQLSYLLLVSELMVGLAVKFTPRQSGDYCASLAHYHWPAGGLLVYLWLFLLAALLLQQYSRWWSISYLGLVVLPLSLGGGVIQSLCAGNVQGIIEANVSSLILIMFFSIYGAVCLLIFLGYFAYISWRKLQLLLPSLALFGLYLLFLEHAILDWVSFVIDF